MLSPDAAFWGFVDLRRILGESDMSLDRLFIWESHWKPLGWVGKLGGARSRNYQGGVN